MFGMRCEHCGEVRWSLLGRAKEAACDCPTCGERMTVERRHPGRAKKLLASERRDKVAAAR